MPRTWSACQNATIHLSCKDMRFRIRQHQPDTGTGSRGTWKWVDVPDKGTATLTTDRAGVAQFFGIAPETPGDYHIRATTSGLTARETSILIPYVVRPSRPDGSGSGTGPSPGENQSNPTYELVWQFVSRHASISGGIFTPSDKEKRTLSFYSGYRSLATPGVTPTLVGSPYNWDGYETYYHSNNHEPGNPNTTYYMPFPTPSWKTRLDQSGHPMLDDNGQAIRDWSTGLIKSPPPTTAESELPRTYAAYSTHLFTSVGLPHVLFSTKSETTTNEDDEGLKIWIQASCTQYKRRLAAMHEGQLVSLPNGAQITVIPRMSVTNLENGMTHVEYLPARMITIPPGSAYSSDLEADDLYESPNENQTITCDLLLVEVKQENMPNFGVADSSTDMASPYSTATISSGGVAFITGQPAMPKLKASFPGLAANINVGWKLEIKTERSERGTKDDKNYPASGYKTLPGNQAWDIGAEFGTDFVGGKCKLFYKVGGGAEQTLEFSIRGKNPKDDDAKAYVNNHAKAATYPYAWAMVQHESRQGNRCYNQFNSGGDGPGSLERPNFTGPDGWGIAQLDEPLDVSASTNEVYEWKKNVDKFYLEMDEKEAATNRFFAAVARTYPNDPDSSSPPASYTVTGTNTAYSAKQLSTMILYNGARGTPVSTLKNGNGNNTSNFQNPWTFSPNRTPKWQFTDNYYNYAVDVIHGEVDGTFQVTE